MSNYFSEPELEVVHLDDIDVICASSCRGAGSEIREEDTCPMEGM